MPVEEATEDTAAQREKTGIQGKGKAQVWHCWASAHIEGTISFHPVCPISRVA